MAHSAPADPRRTNAAGQRPCDVRFDVGSQSAGSISNVCRDQYTAYIAHIQAQRDSFLRDVAGTRTKARWLVRLGLLGMLAGIGIFFWIFAGYLEAFGGAFRDGGNPDAVFAMFEAGFGQEIAGVNTLVVAAVLATGGQILLIVGIVLHIVATARRKRADREFTVPAPWGFPA